MKRNVFLGLALILGATGAYATEVMRMAVTTSFYNSGLSEVLLPEILADLDIEVQLLVVGTGQALKLGEAGDVDAVLVHSHAAEEAFVAAGHATHRREIMYNDFIIIGPSADPASAGGAESAVESLGNIAAAQADFVSRGDDSGTHKMELGLWAEGGHDVGGFGAWYHAVGAGMGQALNTAAGMNGYILSDRASWLNFANKADLTMVFEGDPALFNQYSYLPVNANGRSHIRTDLAAQLEDWLTSPRAQALIDGYQIAGAQLFVFNAGKNQAGAPGW